MEADDTMEDSVGQGDHTSLNLEQQMQQQHQQELQPDKYGFIRSPHVTNDAK